MLIGVEQRNHTAAADTVAAPDDDLRKDALFRALQIYYGARLHDAVVADFLSVARCRGQRAGRQAQRDDALPQAAHSGAPLKPSMTPRR